MQGSLSNQDQFLIGPSGSNDRLEGDKAKGRDQFGVCSHSRLKVRPGLGEWQ